MANPIRRYAWGSTSVIPQLLGIAPDGRPQAELWLGAYESESSSILVDGQWRELADELTRWGHPRLPYLAKVMAIGAPLSLQIHPRSASNAKSEMLYALQPCRTLCGCRPVEAVRALVADLRREGPGPADRLVGRLDERVVEQSAVRAGLAATLELSTAAVIRDVQRRLAGTSWTAVADAVDVLVAQHFPDPACLTPLLLQEVDMAAGEAIWCAPGQPHTYLSGVGFEVQTSSDAVVRAGLTSKPVDRDAFLAGLDTTPGPRPVRPRESGGERVFTPDHPDICLGVIGDAMDRPVELGSDVSGPQIFFCAEGAYDVGVGTTGVELVHGESVFVPDPATTMAVRGKGCLLRVGAGRAR